MDFDTAVDELYGLDPSEFTARRDALAAEARKSGDRGLATAFKGLRKPSAAAYTVNLMARARPDELSHLTGLGERMREAQAALSGEELRALGRQRQQLIAGLAQEARRVARDAGHPVSEAVSREVEATFEAALADARAGAAVREGRLTRALEHTGMDAVDLTGAVAGRGGEGGDGGSAKRPTPARREAEAGQGGRAEAEAEERQRAEAELRRAEEEAERAEEEAGRARERASSVAAEHEAAQNRRTEAEDVVERLEEQLAAARADADRAGEAERRARRERQAAEEEAEDAAAAARRARARADGLRAATA